jgi:acetolactate synthase I/II/III large subunit
MPRVSGGEMLVRALEREGVHDGFTLYGGHLISDDHPLCFGAFGAIHPAAHARRGNKSADLVFLLGTRIGLTTGGRNSLIPADARVIQVDIEAEEIGRGRSIELGIVADCGEFLRQAIAAASNLKFGGHEAWIEQLATMRSGERGKWDEAVYAYHSRSRQRSLIRKGRPFV